VAASALTPYLSVDFPRHCCSRPGIATGSMLLVAVLLL